MLKKVLSIIFICFLIIPLPSFAVVIYENSDISTKFDAFLTWGSTQKKFFPIGTGLSGLPTSLTIYYGGVVSGTGEPLIQINEYGDSNYNTACPDSEFSTIDAGMAVASGRAKASLMEADTFIAYNNNNVALGTSWLQQGEPKMVSTCYYQVSFQFGKGGYSLYGSNEGVPWMAIDTTTEYTGDLNETFLFHTRIITTYPENDEIVATSTPYNAGAKLFLAGDDYEEGTYLSFSFDNQTIRYIGGTSLDAWNSVSGKGLEKKILITDIHEITTLRENINFLYDYGTTFGVYRIIRPTFWSELPLLGVYFTGEILAEKRVSFVIGEKTGLDIALETEGANLAEFLLTGTTTGAVVSGLDRCNPFSNFSMRDCITGLFTLNKTQSDTIVNRLNEIFLLKFPFGYITRTVNIFLDNATTTLPIIEATMPEGLGALSGIGWTINPWEHMGGEDSFVSSVKSTSSGKDTQDILQTPARMFLAFLCISIIYHDLLRIGSSNRHYKRKEEE